ncbi:hypothetical protein VFPPC_18312 [Pochonia chlamydosporia 170]|uniref:Uncharacterized protein n=1 Tax=Pochonia chlamydosporia 170 TaxID=1380566 RepID=A0A219AP95_METCM|nr:hypothetical protein VFPPC_18312 [Pochonia chlamydosporia 170]OWT42573.1 hypothetical protein VFPPC_18312 [Pochonia chlamydosporia 170]
METFEEPESTCLACAWALGGMMASPPNIMSDAEFDITQERKNTKTVSLVPDWHYYNVLPHVCVNGVRACDASLEECFTANLRAESSTDEYYTFGSEYYSFEVSTTITGDVLVPRAYGDMNPGDYTDMFVPSRIKETPVGPALSPQQWIMQFRPGLPLPRLNPRCGPAFASTIASRSFCVGEFSSDGRWSAMRCRIARLDPIYLSKNANSAKKSHDHPVSVLWNRSIPLPTNWDQEKVEKNSQSNDASEVEDKRHPSHALPRRTYNLRNLPSRSQKQRKTQAPTENRLDEGKTSFESQSGEDDGRRYCLARARCRHLPANFRIRRMDEFTD